MTEKTTKTAVKAVDSGLKVNLPITTKPVVIERKMSSKGIADDMTSRIMGKLIGFGDLYDPKTQQFLSEDELKAKGAVFITVSLNKILIVGKDTNAKSRLTKEPTPYIRKTTKIQVIGNVNWTPFINKRGSKDFVSAEQRANKVENYENCKAIGKKDDFRYVCGVVFQVLESAKYYDENGKEYDKDKLTAEYLKTASKASKQKEADKHGIELKFDPQYRTTRIDSCDYLRGFGFEYKPTDNHHNS